MLAALWKRRVLGHIVNRPRAAGVFRAPFGRKFASSSPARLGSGLPSDILEGGDDGEQKGKKNQSRAKEMLMKAMETSAVMFASLAILGLAGLLYHREYRQHTIRKMSEAFDGWNPMIELKTGARGVYGDMDWVNREHQDLINDVVAGVIKGRYYFLFGEKGTGKTSMVLEAIKRVNSKNVIVVDAHADPEIFRIRLGRALNFDYFEDYLGSLFSIRGPRENTAILDIERAFNVLETVGVQRMKKLKQPLVLIINHAHLIRDDENGTDLIELLQQKAESLSGSGIATIIFNSDDYWLYNRLKTLGTRMELIQVEDFSRQQSFQALRRIRKAVMGQDLDNLTADAIYHLVGGRAQYLAEVASKPDPIKACHKLIDREKQWFLNHCALLGENMDDDVMEYGKFSLAAMVLAREFVRLDETFKHDCDGDIILPKIPLWRAVQIMTRPDYIKPYDHLSFFTLDAQSRVKPDSVAMMHAFREITTMPGFNELLNETLRRVDAIESLGRTREIELKDLKSKKYLFKDNSLILDTPEITDDDDDDDQDYYLLSKGERSYWKSRHKHLKSQADSKSAPPV